MATWPTALHGPENDVSIKPGSTISERRLMSGRREVRRFGDGAPDVITCKFRFTEAEYVTFKDFWEDDLSIGTNWFTATWLATMGYSDHKARFLGYPKASPSKGEYLDLSATLIVQASGSVVVSDTTWAILRT